MSIRSHHTYQVGWAGILAITALIMCHSPLIAQPTHLRDDDYPIKYQHRIPIDLQDKFESINKELGSEIFSWEGSKLKDISDSDCKIDCKEWFAQMKVPFGNQATLYATRWDDLTWIRGVTGQLLATDGKLLWQGQLTYVEGGDGGTIERKTVLHDLDRDGVLDMVMYEYEWYYDYSQQDSLGMGIREAERLWVLRLQDLKMDSIPLLLTPLTRELFVSPEEGEPMLRRVMPTDSLPAISHGRIHTAVASPCFLVMRRGDFWGEHFAWKGTGILEDDLGKGWQRILTDEGVGSSIFLRTVAEAQSWQRMLPVKLQRHSCIVLRDECKGTSRPAKPSQEVDLECDCIH